MDALLSIEPLLPAAAFELHLHPVAVACVLLTVAALFWCGIHTISFLFGRGLADRDLLRPAGSTGPRPSGSAAGPQGRHFVMICLAMGAALNAETLDAFAAELGLHPGAVSIIVLAVAMLFNLAIFNVNFLVARRPAEGETTTVLRATASAAAAPIYHASRPPLPRFVVLCLAMGTALLAAAATDLGVHSVVVASFVLAVTGLYNWEILTINFHVARRPAEREPKMLPRPASPAASSARSPNLARLAFLVLAALVSASWFVESFAAAAELCLSKAVIFAFVVLFAALFNISVHLFRSFFLPDPPSAVTAAA